MLPIWMVISCWSCSSGSDDPVDNPVENPESQKDVLTATAAKNEFSARGGELSIQVKANITYETVVSDTWITATESRTLTTKTLVFKIAENNSSEKREGKITIKGGEFNEEIKVYQDGIPFTIKQKEYSLSPNGSRFLIDISYNQPYKILKCDSGLSDSEFVIKEEGHDQLVYFAWAPQDSNNKEIIISDEKELYTDTIRVNQTEEPELLHGGGGNSVGAYGYVVQYTGGIVSFDVYTDLEEYDILVFGNTDKYQAKHVRSEKTNFGFKEYFEVPYNDTDKTIEFNFAYVGPNITFMTGTNVSHQLFVYFDEPDEMYISENGETFTTHAWTVDNNLNIRLDGGDTSWLTIKQTDDTYVNGVRRINTTFEAEPNNTGKTREITVIAFNGFNDQDAVRIIQPSGDGVLLSSERMIVGAWENTQTIILKDREYTIEPVQPTYWITIGESNKENSSIKQTLKFAANKEEKERNAELIIKSGTITHTLKIRQLPESGALVDDSSERWKSFPLPPVEVKQPYPNETGSMLYFAIVENPEEFIHIQSRRVLDLLYFSPEDEFIPKLKSMEYVLDNYDGVSACYSGGGMAGIVLSNQYVEYYYNSHDAKALVEENKGVLAHELTHAFQLDPQGCGDYNSSKVFHSCIEGMADAVRVLSGGFPNKDDRPRGGHYLDSYRYTGFFLAWCVNNKDKDFLRKFNLSTQYVNPWSFDGAIKYILGEQYNVDDLWNEYLKAMGDI